MEETKAQSLPALKILDDIPAEAEPETDDRVEEVQKPDTGDSSDSSSSSSEAEESNDETERQTEQVVNLAQYLDPGQNSRYLVDLATDQIHIPSGTRLPLCWEGTVKDAKTIRRKRRLLVSYETEEVDLCKACAKTLAKKARREK